jgi:hypothetical protein
MIILTPQRLHVAAGKHKDFDMLFDYLLNKAEEYLINTGDAMEPIGDIQTEVDLWLMPTVFAHQEINGKKQSAYDEETTNIILMVDAISKYQEAFKKNDCREVSRLTYTITSYAIAASGYDHEDFSVEVAEQFEKELVDIKVKREKNRQKISIGIAESEKTKKGDENKQLVLDKYKHLIKTKPPIRIASIIADQIGLSASQVRKIINKSDLKKKGAHN